MVESEYVKVINSVEIYKVIYVFFPGRNISFIIDEKANKQKRCILFFLR